MFSVFICVMYFILKKILFLLSFWNLLPWRPFYYVLSKQEGGQKILFKGFVITKITSKITSLLKILITELSGVNAKLLKQYNGSKWYNKSHLMPPISFYNLYKGSCHCSLSKTTIRAYRKRSMAWNLLITITFSLELYNSNFLFSSNSKLIFPLEWKVEGKITVANIVNKNFKKSRSLNFNL